jgi:hypothetical protein
LQRPPHLLQDLAGDLPPLGHPVTHPGSVIKALKKAAPESQQKGG